MKKLKKAFMFFVFTVLSLLGIQTCRVAYQAARAKYLAHQMGEENKDQRREDAFA